MSDFKVGDRVIASSRQGEIVGIHEPSLVGTSICVDFGGGSWQCFKPERLRLAGGTTGGQ